MTENWIQKYATGMILNLLFKCHCHIFLLMTKLKLRTIAQKVCSEDQPPKKFREHEATCLVEMPTGDNDRTDLLSRKVSRPRGMLSSLILAWHDRCLATPVMTEMIELLGPETVPVTCVMALWRIVLFFIFIF